MERQRLGLLMLLAVGACGGPKDTGDSKGQGDDTGTSGGGTMDLSRVSNVGAAAALANQPGQLMQMDLLLSWMIGISTCPSVVEESPGVVLVSGPCDLDQDTRMVGSLRFATREDSMTAVHEGFGLTQGALSMTWTGTLGLVLTGDEAGTLSTTDLLFSGSGIDPAWGTSTASASFTRFSTFLPVTKGMIDTSSTYTASVEGRISEATLGSFEIEGQLTHDPSGCDVEAEGGSETVTARGSATVHYDSVCDGCVRITLSDGTDQDWCPPGYEPGQDTGWY
jgi:hypothetical protein